VGFFFEFYPYFPAAFIMVISSRQLKVTEGKMKQFVELLEGKTVLSKQLMGK